MGGQEPKRDLSGGGGWGGGARTGTSRSHKAEGVHGLQCDVSLPDRHCTGRGRSEREQVRTQTPSRGRLPRLGQYEAEQMKATERENIRPAFPPGSDTNLREGCEFHWTPTGVPRTRGRGYCGGTVRARS